MLGITTRMDIYTCYYFHTPNNSIYTVDELLQAYIYAGDTASLLQKLVV